MHETLFAFAPRLTDFLSFSQIGKIAAGGRASRVFRPSSDIYLRLKE